MLIIYSVQKCNKLVILIGFLISSLVPVGESLIQDSNNEKLRLTNPELNAIIRSPRWLIVGGRKIVPGSLYRVVIEALRGRASDVGRLTVHAVITCDHQHVTSGQGFADSGELSHILLQIPDYSFPGEWQLIVEGFEGPSNFPIFKRVTTLTFLPRFLTILIQTSRPIYNAKQTVRFRAVMLTRGLKPYEGPVDVRVLDPRNRIMRRWPSRQTGNGIISLKFDLPEYPSLGNWTIQIQVRQQVQNKTILVEQYFKPIFEVFVRLPHAFKVTDKEITGVVVANMTNWRYVSGNCTITLQISTNSDYPIPTQFETVHELSVAKFIGFYGFSLPMSLVTSRAGNQKQVVVLVSASVTEVTHWSTNHGWALAQIVKEEAKIQFLGDQPLIFWPGMPITVHVLASYSDGHPFEREEFTKAVLTVTLFAPKMIQMQSIGTELVDEDGVAMCTFAVPSDARSIELSASFVSSNGLSSEASINGIATHSPLDRQLQIETSTYDAAPGQNMVFHVRNNFFIAFFNYLVVANGQIVHNGREYINDINVPSITTFSLPASSEMAPIAKVLVWVLDQDNGIVAHSLAIPINPLARHEVSLEWNEHKDHSGGTVEITFKGEKGAYFAAHSVWEETYLMNAGNIIDKTEVLLQMTDSRYSDDIEIVAEEDVEDLRLGAIPNIRRSYTRSRNGHGSSVRFFPTTIAGPDVPTTFHFSEVSMHTDAMIYYYPSKSSGSTSCKNHTLEGSSKLLQCLTGGCYPITKRCDGYYDCPDASDEAGCFVNVDSLRNFRLHRVSRQSRIYADSNGEDWAWSDVRGVGNEIEVFSIPKIPQNWYFSFFAVGTEKGLGILEQPVQFNSAFTFNLNVHAPNVVRMWEQVGLMVGIFNFHSSTVAVRITLPASPDYQTIRVEPNGIVNSYDPKRLVGTFQHLVWLPKGESTDVPIPIVFSRLGKISITVIGDTQMQSDSHTFTIEVIPEGAYIAMHTSILFDLKDRALVYDFMDINLDESPIIPYKLRRRYIFGTPEGHISVSGDIAGPAFPEIPVNEANLLGYNVMGAETSAFNFASNIWSLHYLRLTDQITDEIIYEVLNAANVYYAGLSCYQSESGGFFNWIGSEESVWLTAHALKNLWIANFQDWENHIFIDHSIIQAGVEFLLRYQTISGSFEETIHYLNPLDPKVDPRTRTSKDSMYQSISLTAQVVIAMQSVMSGLGGGLRRRAYQAMKKAVGYLERGLQTLTDPYELAITAWALTKADSKDKNLAYSLLDRIKIVFGDRVYWSREPIEFHTVVYENNQRPYLQPKSDNRWDAYAVEATAYALLVYIKQEGIGIMQENIVRFLSSMRELDGGIISSVDSLVAREALIEYSYRARIRDLTNMKIYIEPSANPNSSFQCSIHKNTHDLSELKLFQLNNLFGHVTVIGRGSGQGLLQLHYSYNVDSEEEKEFPVVPSFEINVVTRYNGRNSSQLTITSCQRWINTEESETSGLTVVEIHLPSGYRVLQNKLTDMVLKRSVRNLRWAYVTKTDVKFFFNKLDSETVCFTYRIYRRFPVSNHSRYGSIRIYELYQPERFEMKLLEVYPLYSLDICEVCGSFQCPYCPFYSGSRNIYPKMVVLTAFYLFSLFNNPTCPIFNGWLL